MMISPENAPLQLVTASAGSGKTFQLVHRYLALIARGADPAGVLATTFSRKAAQEIFERLVLILLECAEDEAVASEVGARIEVESFDGKEAYEILRRVLAAQSRLLIGTLDSFAQSLGRVFYDSLGLSESWDIPDGLSQSYLEEEALRELLESVPHEERGAILSSVTADDASRSVFWRLHSRLSKLSLYGERLPRDGFRWSIHELLPEKEVVPFPVLIEELRELPPPLTKSGTPAKSWVKAKEQSIEALECEEWSLFLSRGIPGVIAKGGDTFYRQEIPPDWRVLYERAIYGVLYQGVGELVTKTAQVATLLESFSERLRALQYERRSFGFNDVKMRLASSLASIDNLELIYRLDRKVQHLLLDEFQDTTPTEWEMIAPIVSEIAASPSIERSLFCVGDPKQAIYGWRGGSALLFGELKSAVSHIEESALVTSYRSSPVIMNFVNEVFGGLLLTESFSEESEGNERLAATNWLRGFSEHTAAREEHPGSISIRIVEEGESREEEVVRAVGELLGNNPELSVGVLVRSNSELLPLVLNFERAGIEVSAEGGSPLTDSPVVVAVLALLQCALFPADTRSWFHLIRTPLVELLEREKISEESLGDIEFLEECARGIRREIASVGLPRYIQRAVSVFSPVSNPRDEVRGAKLVELAIQNGSELGSGGVQSFISRVRGVRVEDERPGVVRVMTIHRSKGLEFDAVFLPRLDASFTRVLERTLLTERSSDGMREERAILYADRHIRAHVPRLAKMYDGLQERNIEEELSVFYVALTRARSAIEIFLSDRDPKTLSGEKILKEVFKDELPYLIGDTEWWRTARGEETEEDGEEVSSESGEGELGDLSQTEERKKFFPVRTATSRRRRGLSLSSEARARGEEIHKRYEAITWLEERGKNPVEECFTLSRYGVVSPDEVELYRELPFSFFSGEVGSGSERIVKGVIDRLVVYQRDCQRCVEIVDLKSGYLGEIGEPALHQMREQLAVYERGVEKLFPETEGRIQKTLAFVDRGEVITYDTRLDLNLELR